MFKTKKKKSQALLVRACCLYSETMCIVSGFYESFSRHHTIHVSVRSHNLFQEAARDSTWFLSRLSAVHLRSPPTIKTSLFLQEPITVLKVFKNGISTHRVGVHAHIKTKTSFKTRQYFF